jgi:acetyl/propionyl-CoA carboxylase alpha subunit
VTVYSEADAMSMHTRASEQSFLIQSSDPTVMPYLSIDALIAVAKQSNCDCVHPGYGFLSENFDFASRCAAEGLHFIGPKADALVLFGDKVLARRHAISCDVPVVPGSEAPLSSGEEAKTLVRNSIGYPVMLKAAHGGGGRGMRVVEREEDIVDAFDACQREAMAAFGNDTVFVERLVRRARHVEVQILADAHGDIVHLFTRDCSVQLRNQKMVEVAPAPNLSPEMEKQMLADALKLAHGCGYINAGTVEFLVSPDTLEYFFIECNPRIQVEHTVTEQVTGVDLVEAQFEIGTGATLVSLGIEQSSLSTRGYAVQARIVAKGAGTIVAYKEPSGVGVRVDACCYANYTPPSDYDPLMAKVICWSTSPNFASAAARTARALEEFHIVGLPTNIPTLLAVLRHPEFPNARTSFLVDFPEVMNATQATPNGGLIQLYEQQMVLDTSKAATEIQEAPAGCAWICSPLQGRMTGLQIKEGDDVSVGSKIAILLSMKMEHEVASEFQGRVVSLQIVEGETVEQGQPILLLELSDAANASAAISAEKVDLTRIRPELQEVFDARASTEDAYRREHDPKFGRRLDARHTRGLRSARENVYDLVDEGTFNEYGRFVTAAQRLRRSEDNLMLETPADGLVTGIGCVNGEIFPPERSRTVVLAYDYTVRHYIHAELVGAAVDGLFWCFEARFVSPSFDILSHALHLSPLYLNTLVFVVCTKKSLVYYYSVLQVLAGTQGHFSHRKSDRMIGTFISHSITHCQLLFYFRLPWCCTRLVYPIIIASYYFCNSSRHGTCIYYIYIYIHIYIYIY